MSRFHAFLRGLLRQRLAGTVIILYLWAWSVSPAKAMESLKYGAHLFASISVIILAVFALIGLINVRISRELIVSLLGQNSGVRGLLLAVGCGAVLVGPAYVIFPLLISVKQLGARWAVIAIVLASWSLKPQMLPIEAEFLGFHFALVRGLLVLLLAIPLGLAVEWLMPNESTKIKNN
ncbi:MAG TPA: hypothetical protein ENK33_10155 [Desulfobacterales bacterium]|nr:hypothetical protein [Desulfobacterales bacterium]